MAFIFTMRSTRVGSSLPHSGLASTNSLPVIEEDDASVDSSPLTPPLVPTRAWNRPVNKAFGLGLPPSRNHENSPPAYGHFYSVEGPNGEKLSDLRKGINNHKYIARRGGWKRFVLIALLATLCIMGLAIGLILGLRNRNKDSSPSTNGGSNTSSTPAGGASGTVEAGPPNPAANTTFPAGSYSIETFLDTVSTNCTSNSATWTCFPYSTYASSPSQSAATFDWIISPVQGTNNYTISSTQNYFSIIFSNASLSLLNAGTDQEHYFFQVSMQKPTNPTAALTSSNVAATCYFNETTFQAYLYTKLEKSYPANSTSTNTTEAFTPWPYAVKVEQVAAAGSGTPTCLDASGNSVGDFSISDPGQLCDCLYLNTGT